MSRPRKLVGSIIFVACSAVVSYACYAKLSGSLSEEAILKRLTPAGNVTVDGNVAKKTVAAGAGSPATIYKKHCRACHHTGAAGAPKWGDAKEWNKRLKAQGREMLTTRAYDGFNAMPPKGNCPKCTKQDIHDTIEFILGSI